MSLFTSSLRRSTAAAAAAARAGRCSSSTRPRPNSYTQPAHTNSLFTSSRRLAAAAAEPENPSSHSSSAAAAANAKPIGAFRGGIFGFLTGSLVTGLTMYFYTFDDYRASNAGLSADILALQTATQHLNSYVLELEGMVNRIQSSPQTK